MHNVVILGSGRSGTSMTAGVLSRAGYFMGHKVLNKGRINNPFGNYEDQEVNNVNEQLLGQVIPQPETIDGVVRHRDRPAEMQRWLGRLPVGTSIESLPACVTKIRELISHEPFCFKDPRFSYTLSVWRPHLTDTVYVCVFRGPHKTAQSILKQVEDAPHLRGLEMSFSAALEVWSLMYRHILEIHSREGAWLFLHYDQLLTEAGLNKLSRFTGAPVLRDFPQNDLRREYLPAEVPAEVEKIYAELCHHADFRVA